MGDAYKQPGFDTILILCCIVLDLNPRPSEPNMLTTKP